MQFVIYLLFSSEDSICSTLPHFSPSKKVHTSNLKVQEQMVCMCINQKFRENTSFSEHRKLSPESGLTTVDFKAEVVGFSVPPPQKEGIPLHI